jgi:VanZ family protein
MSLFRHKSQQSASVDLKELQNLFQGIPDFVIDSIGGKGDQPRGEVGQELFKLQALFGYRSFSQMYFILSIHSGLLYLWGTAAVPDMNAG